MGAFIKGNLPTEFNGITMKEAVYWADIYLKDNPCDRMWDAMRALRDFYETVTSEAVEVADRKTEPQICDICRYYNSNIPCGSTPSACKEADKFAEEFVDGLKKLKPTISKMEQVEDEPQRELVNDSPILAKDLVDDEFNPYDEECMRCKHLKLQCEFVPSYCKYEPRDEPQTERSSDEQ